jgi:hypothetical protein
MVAFAVCRRMISPTIFMRSDRLELVIRVRRPLACYELVGTTKTGCVERR